MDETMTKLRILASAEVTLARIRARRLAVRAALYAVAVGLVLLAVVMVNIGAYQLLSETYGQNTSAFIVAAGNAVLAIMVVFAAYSIKPGPDEQMAREIREMALAELAADVEDLRDNFGKLGTDVKRIRTGFSVLASGRTIGAGIASLAPVIGVLMEMIRHRREKKAKTSSG